jgi:membrane protein required for colicin V production
MPEILDYIILGFVVLGFILGFKDGFIKKIFSLAGFVLAIIAALTFSPRARAFLVNSFDLNPSTAVVISFLLVFLIVILISKIIIKLIRPKKSLLGFIDRILGGLTGMFQMGLFLSGLLIILSFFNFPPKEQKSNLKYYNFTYNLLPNTFSFVKNIYPESEVVFDLIKDLKVKMQKKNG